MSGHQEMTLIAFALHQHLCMMKVRLDVCSKRGKNTVNKAIQR